MISNHVISGSGAAIMVAALLVGSATAGAQEAVNAALNRCAAIEEDTARLTCYDALAELLVRPSFAAASASPSEVPAAAAPASAPSAPSVVPLTDDVGKERVDPPSDEDQPRFAASVVSCRNNPQSGQMYFTMENGQVWKQSNYRRLNLRDCEFDVEISRNAFGYEMYIPSKDRTVRISRLR